MFILTVFKKWCFDKCISLTFLTSITVSTVNLRLRKNDFFLSTCKLISETFFLLGLLKFKIKQWSLAYQDQILCWVWSRSTAGWDCSSIVSESFLKRNSCIYLEDCFSNLFNFSARICCSLSFAQLRKILSRFSKLSAILKHSGKTL